MSISSSHIAVKDEEEQVELLEFEEKLMIETLTDDVLFVVAR